jgi:PAS domain S-box-containing protein
MTSRAPEVHFLVGGGEMGALMRARDWSQSPIGTPGTWPDSLKTAIQLLLNTGHPMYVWWGPELLCFYNDAYSRYIGSERHPGSLGKPGRHVWAEIWDTIGPQITYVMSGAGATWNENQLIPITRDGRREDVYWTYSYGPLLAANSAGGVGGVLVVCTETTKQVLAERHRAEELDRQKLLFDQAPGFICTLKGPDHVFEFFNASYRRVFGADGWEGKSVREAMPDIEGQGFFELLDEVYTSGKRHVANGAEITFRKPAEAVEETRYLDFVYEPIREADGSVTGIFCEGYDVTDRMQAVSQLRDSETRLHAITNSIDQMVWSTLPNGDHDYFNERWYEFTGVPAGSTDGDGWNAIFHPEDQPRAWERWRRSLETGEPYHIEYRLRHRSGTYRWVIGRAQCVRDEGGAISRWFGTCTDVQEIVEARETLKRSREELEDRVAEQTRQRNRVWEMSRDLFAIIDFVGQLKAINPAWEATLGITKTELMQLPLRARVHPDDYEAVLGIMKRLDQGETVGGFEDRLQHADGSWRWIAWSLVAEGEVFYAVGRDITAEKGAATELRNAQEALRQSQKMEAMGQLTGGVAHDFNNLLTPIVGGLDMLQRNGVGGEREQRLISGALQSAERAKTPVQRLLAFARRQPLQPSSVDIRQLVDGMADLLASTTGPQIKVVVELEDDLPSAKADTNQLEMALLNLGVNARDAMPDGGVLRITATVEQVQEGQVHDLAAGIYVRLSVADTGSGMDAATLARAAEPFYSTKGIGKGTGLGLSMVHGLAAQLGGSMIITSTVGVGTNVELYLPESSSADSNHHDFDAAAPAAPEVGTVLLVDDEELVRMSTADMLAELGYQVIEAASGEEALRLITGGLRPDMLVSDHLMHGITGVELATRMRADQPDLPVLIVSGYADVEGISVDLPRLTKPFRKSDLAAHLAAILPAV